jgi:ABC-type Na+ efflux pump permease subunit
LGYGVCEVLIVAKVVSYELVFASWLAFAAVLLIQFSVGELVFFAAQQC